MPTRPKRSACILGVMSGTYRTCENGQYSKGRMLLKIRCGRWDCPYCRERKAKRLYKRAMSGEIAAEAQRAGFRTYNIKLLTLTYGGKGKRSGSSPAEAAIEMQGAWAKLRKELRHLFGGFHFLKVFETHEDGWPHLHVVMCGENISPVKVLAEIERLWRYRYGFGFVKMNWCSDPKRALRYVLKYLFKCPVQFKDLRLFTCSEGALQRVQGKVDRVWEELRLWWREGGATFRECERLLVRLGEEEEYIEAEVFPVKGCPF